MKIGFMFYLIDDWDATKNYVSIKLDDVELDKIKVLNVARNGNLCGKKKSNDGFGVYERNLTHIGSSLKISIEPILDKSPYDASFGIREFYVIVDYVMFLIFN